jgi:hypothetical protein
VISVLYTETQLHLRWFAGHNHGTGSAFEADIHAPKLGVVVGRQTGVGEQEREEEE